MHEPNARKILDLLKPRPEAQVLDVGGWACPFNRANWVMDAEPYETRGYYKRLGLPASQGGDEECFTRDTWIQRDICDKAPWPFPDKYFDFSICSHTMEDVRDPLYVCSELIRVSRAGYIEVPSRAMESCRGLEHPEFAGLSHHRWLVEISDSHIQFTPKYHSLHGDLDNALPWTYLARMSETDRISFLFWENGFSFRETFIHGTEKQQEFLKDFVAARYRYPLLRRWGYQARRFVIRNAQASLRRIARLVRRNRTQPLHASNGQT